MLLNHKKMLIAWILSGVGLFGLSQLSFFQTEPHFEILLTLLLLVVILECYLRIKKQLKKMESERREILHKNVLGQLNLWTEIRASFEKLEKKDSSQ